MSTTGTQVAAGAGQRRAARRWLGLALSVLVLAGLFAVAVVIGRMPPFDRYVTDPLFFKRCLVAHVNLALIAWFYSFIAALLLVVPTRREAGALARGSPSIGVAGIALMLLGAGMPGSRPLLSNYIPTVDHWMFQLGQLVFGLGVLAAVVDRRLPDLARTGGSAAGPSPGFPDAARAGLCACSAALLLAALTFALTWLAQAEGLAPSTRHDLLVWGGGHVLQLVSATAMVSVWLLLLTSLLGASPVGGPAAAALFASMLAPWALAPVLAFEGSSSAAYRTGFTSLMRWGLFPVVGIFAILCASALVRAWRQGRLTRASLADPRLSAFAVSAALTGIGFGLGAAIRGPNTMIPAHYHASVGAVTVALMVATWWMLPALGFPVTRARLWRVVGWQPAVYGVGMAIFAGGFALAGAHGMERKVYGAEQALRGSAETLGLGLMGVGGFVAIAGGVLFLGSVVVAWWSGAAAERAAEGLVKSPWRWRYGAQRPG